jgi:Holliday junction resolvase RusA-like endonuclease
MKVTRDDTKPLFRAVIPGRCIVKKNTKNLVGRGRFKRAVYSKKFVMWEQNALVALLDPSLRLLIDIPVTAYFKFYFANRQSEADVSNLVEGPQDVIVKAGILRDDKLVMRIIAEKFFGESARTEVELYAYDASVAFGVEKESEAAP